MVVQHPSRSQPTLVLHVTPVEDRETDFRTWRRAALVLAIEPNEEGRIDRRVLRAKLGLSAAESEVVALIAEGKSIPGSQSGDRTRGTHRALAHQTGTHEARGVPSGRATRIVRAVGGVLPSN